MKATDFVFQPFTSRPDPLPPRLPAAADRVEIFNYQFGPQTLRVRAGATVTWVNYDLVPHDVKAADASFESGNLSSYGRYFLTFERPGTYEYFCGVHLEMRARVIVER
jgi:plastocyanin